MRSILPWEHVIGAQIRYKENLTQLQPNKPKLFHSYVRNRKINRPKVSQLLVNRNLMTTPALWLECLLRLLPNIFVAEPSLNSFPHQVCLGNLSPVIFSHKDIFFLNKLNIYSAMGPDNPHPRLLKECASEFAYPLPILFNKSMPLGLLPQAWTFSHVTYL